MGELIRLDDARRRRAGRGPGGSPAEPGLDGTELAVVVEVVGPDLVHLTTTERIWGVVGPALQSAGVRLISAPGGLPDQRPAPARRSRRPGGAGSRPSSAGRRPPARRP
jgi:hypothetical protein